MLDVLVVEDSRFFTAVLRKAVEERLGFRMVHAASRADAGRILAERQGDIFAALVDLNLPDSIDGEVVDDVIAAGIPAVVFTSSFDDDLRELMLSKNVVDYVTKNNHDSIEQVITMLRRLAGNANVKVLVVDDSKVSRRHFTSRLASHRFHIIEASGGAEALRILDDNPDVRLVITDYHMPEMDGCALTEAIRRRHPRDRMVIIGISAYGNNVLSARFMKAGASDFINKPFIPEELFCRIYQNLDFIEQIQSLTRVGVSLANARQAATPVTEADLLANPAYYDPVTRLPNRRLFLDRLGVAMAFARRSCAKVALILLDLDLFKRINDSLGHFVGDQVLAEMASRLKGCVREGDTIARIDGDEFAVIVPEVANTDDLTSFIRRAAAAIQAPVQAGPHELFITASIGVAVFPDDGADLDQLTRNAEAAMYRAKEAGRNTFQLYAPAMHARSSELLSLESALRQAVGNREFKLVYQGKVDMESGMLTGVEALIRWHHPVMGTISPADFIPMAESLGLVSEIGAWALREACRQAVEWQRQGLPPLGMSVNVSARQFRDQDVAALVAEVLQQTGLAPGFLELELTETVLMQRVDDVAGILGDLRAIGVRISVDDFGTGYSSLSYLSRMPLDALKIDRAFVKDVTASDEADEIVATIINLAHSLKLKAVAEGVETLAQAMFLHQKGCDQLQGFLVSRPMAPAELVSLMDRKLLAMG